MQLAFAMPSLSLAAPRLTSTINSTCGAYERSWGNGPCGKKGKEIKLRNRPWVSAEWEHCHSLFLCHFFRPWATR